jgi:V-type H+-transporting ATPase subunit a
MKMSVIIGVIQMSLGIFLHLLNAIHFRNTLDIIGEFIPRVVFLWCIFGYLCIMIFIKWATDYPTQDVQIKYLEKTHNWTRQNITDLKPELKGTGMAPVLLNEMIFMVLPGGSEDNLYPNQHLVQPALVVIAILMIPIMACLKPCYTKPPACCFRCFGCCPRCQELGGPPVKVHHHHQNDEDSESERFIQEEGGHGGGGHGHEEDFGEMMVHQILETIEFVLGSVSHTASYLRLWALSLAHSELATVFWDKVVFLLIEYTVDLGGAGWFVVGLATWAGFSIWFFITFIKLTLKLDPM